MTEDVKLYRVRWEIEVEAETPLAAAEKARHYQTKPGTTATVFEDNRDVWSGDHCSLDPDLVRGVFFSSKPFHADRVPGIADATASIRALIGAPAPADAAGKSLW